jgi:hypothetical protein
MEGQPTPEKTAEQTEQPPRKLTAYEVRNQYLEYIVLTLWAFALFYFDGWRNPDIKATGFNKTVAVLLAGYSLFCFVMFASAQFNISRQPPVTPDLLEVRSRFLWILAKFVGLMIWFIQDRSNPEVSMKPFDWYWLFFGIGVVLYSGYRALTAHMALQEQQPPPQEPPAGTANPG